MQTTQKVDELLQVLKDRGLNEDAVENVKEGIWTQASDHFMQDLLLSLTEEDMKSIEATTTQEEANVALRKLYNEKTGKDMDEEMMKVVDQQAEELIQKYKMDGETMPVISESTDHQEEKLLEPVAEDGRTEVHSEEKSDEDKIHDLT
jgi:hypothetical protein